MINQEKHTLPVNKQIKFKTPMLRSSYCDYADAYIRVKGNVTVNILYPKVLPEIMLLKKYYLKIVLHLLTA